MWILIKLLIAWSAFVYRLFRKYLYFNNFANPIQVDGVTVYEHVQRSKNSVVGTTFTIHFHCRSIFKLTRESTVDRFFKAIGFAKEVQTGDKDFDQKIYIASDSSAFANEIRIDSQTRQNILAVFRGHCDHITCDGEHITFSYPGDASLNAALKQDCVRLFKQMSDIDKTWKGFFQDPFAIKALFVESVIWGFGTYAAAGFAEYTFYRADVHLDGIAILKNGMIYGGFVALGLIGFVIAFMRGSSRGHRIIVESAVVLGISLPFGGANIVSDLNTRLDKSPPVFQDMKVHSSYELVHTGRRGRKWYSYHLQLDWPDSPREFSIPGNLEVTMDVQSRFKKGMTARFEIGRGHLGHPWIRSITPAN